MWQTRSWIWVIVLGPMLAVGGIFLFLAFTTSPDALADDGSSLKNLFYFIGASFIVFPLVGALGVFYFFKRINDRETFLLNEGLEGEAEILSREQTGTYLNEQPQVKFKLLVTVAGEEPYQLEHKEYVNLLDVGSIAQGMKIPVMVDPRDPKNILLIYS